MSIVVWMSAISALMPAQQVPPVQQVSSVQVQAYREFAATMPGDAVRGKAIFQREAIGCANCHTIGEGSRRAGPDLLAIGDKYPRTELILAVLEPSAFILTGYAATTFVTESGTVHSGIIARRDPEEIELLLATNQRIRLASNTTVEEQRSSVSLMPSGVERLLAPQEFSDLISYLATLKQPAPKAVTGLAIPENIARLERPVQFEPLHSEEIRFERPIWFDVVPGTMNRFVVAQHNPPEIWLLEKSESGEEKTLFLSLNDEAVAGEDTGILGMAFHPDFLANRRYYVYHHVREQGSQGAVIVERLASEDYRRDSGVPSRRLVHIKRWTVAHTGGVMVFGADGLMYVGVGDGGPQEDPEGNGQNPRLLLGSILRIDVDGRTPGLPYAIPASNPFFRDSDPKVRKEIWALGFRQPWRLSFDPATHDLWVGDVGQTNYEEVTIVRMGENHGWNVYEGHVRFSDKYRKAGLRYVQPVVSLLRKHGVSVTGGHVYRGQKNPSYQGVYIFGDFESKRVWGLMQENRTLKQIREIGTSPDRIVSFGIDTTGELYIVGYNTGTIYRIRLDDSVFE
jgi:putative heme-binding domain-containing protein